VTLKKKREMLAQKMMKKPKANISPEVGKRITDTARGLEGLRQEGESWRRPLPPDWANKKSPYINL
jgi:hypothetical protein